MLQDMQVLLQSLNHRFFLFYKAIELGCERFFSCIRNSEGSQGLLVRIEGNDDQVSDFKNFIEDQAHIPQFWFSKSVIFMKLSSN